MASELFPLLPRSNVRASGLEQWLYSLFLRWAVVGSDPVYEKCCVCLGFQSRAKEGSRVSIMSSQFSLQICDYDLTPDYTATGCFKKQYLA